MSIPTYFSISPEKLISTRSYVKTKYRHKASEFVHLVIEAVELHLKLEEIEKQYASV